ncbi:MAG: M1 family metallopeptidase [Candidatus Aminicenantes bacterium]|nr:M1 family metallopeptidase [Candidatus Aminicenantes bacterium]
MKKAPLAVLLAAGLSLSAFSQGLDWSKKALQAERTRTYDARHYLIKISLDLEGKTFEGATTVTAASLREGLATCVLDAEEFTVTSVFDAYGEPLAFEQTAKELTIRLPRPQKFGEEFTFTCTYRGRNPKIGLKFVAETEDNPRIVFSDSFPENVHHWFPCYDYPNDKVTNEIVATVEKGLKVAANGRLVGVTEDPKAGTVTYHWSQDLPHSTYLIFMAAAPYVVVRDSYGTLPVNYWVYPQDEAKAGPTYGKTPRMIEFFNTIFDYEYPWQKYDQVSVPSGGGAESTSATAMTHRIMVDEKGEPDFPAIGIVSHELAHQWWGDLITLRSWAHTWLNESFGTYSDYLYHRFEKGDDEGAVNLREKLESYLREARTRYIRPIVSDRYDAPGDMFDAHTYPKGARVLHMLRSLLGDGVFFKVLSHFLHRYAFDAVDTADFIRSVKTVTGRNLDWFFDQWLFKPGHPVFAVKSEWNAAAKTVRLRVAQVQDFARGVPVFRIPLSVKLVTPGKTDVREVWVDEREELFEFPLEEKPLLVRFDPDNVLLKEISFPKEIDELVYQLGHDDVIGRMDAAAALAAFKDDPRAAAALVSSLQTDPFWAVRKSSLESAAKLGLKNAPALYKKTCRDADSRVRAAAIAALGDLKDRALLEFYKDLFLKDPSYRVQTEALTAVGKTGDSSAVPFLKEASAVPSYRHMVRRAAEAALKQLDPVKR